MSLGVWPDRSLGGVYGINNRGQMTGYLWDEAAIWWKGTITELGWLTEATLTLGNAINNSGVVVGWADVRTRKRELPVAGLSVAQRHDGRTPPTYRRRVLRGDRPERPWSGGGIFNLSGLLHVCRGVGLEMESDLSTYDLANSRRSLFTCSRLVSPSAWEPPG